MSKTAQAQGSKATPYARTQRAFSFMAVSLAFYRGRKRWVSRLIAWWQNSAYSHVEIVLSRTGNKYECASSSFLDGGVRIKVMELDREHWDLVRIPGDAAEAREWFLKHQGERYDWFGLFGFVFRPLKGWAKAWWCSEAVAASLGFKEPWRYDVADLFSVCSTLKKRKTHE